MIDAEVQLLYKEKKTCKWCKEYFQKILIKKTKENAYIIKTCTYTH